LFYDVPDKEMDRLTPHKKNRPLVSNVVSEKNVMIIIYLSAVTGLSIALFLNFYTFISSLILLLVFGMYSYPKIRFKTMFLLKDLTIFSGFIWCSLIGSFAVSNSLSITALFSGLLFAIYASSANPIFGDTLDMEADKKFGVKNLAIILSWKRKVQLMITTILFIMTITPLTYVRLGFNVVVPIVVVAMGLVLLRLMFPIMGRFESVKVIKIRKFVFAGLFILQILAVVGTLNLNMLF